METGILIAISAVLGLLRLLGHSSEAFQAIAHLFVGGLLGAWLAARRRDYLWLAVGLSVVEVVAFLVFRGRAH